MDGIHWLVEYIKAIYHSVEMSYTNVIYQHPEFEVVKNGDFASCVARESISEGDILLIEHSLVSDDIAKIVNIVYQNVEMYLTLCPHESDSEPRNPDVATKKVASNMFRTDDLFALGRTVSMINHSCSPNALVTYTHIHEYSIPVSFIVVYAVRDIQPHEEICIMYGATVGHDDNEYHSWVCTCGQSDDERAHMFESIKQTRVTASSSSKRTYHKHMPIIQSYVCNGSSEEDPASAGATAALTTTTAVEDVIALQQLAMEAGVYKMTPDQLAPTARFEEYIKEHWGLERGASDAEKYQALMTTLSNINSECMAFLSNLTWSESS